MHYYNIFGCVYLKATWALKCLIFTKVVLFSQNVSVLEQEKIDKLMLDMDGTENKCKIIYTLQFFFSINYSFGHT